MPQRGLANDYSWNSKRMLIKKVLRRPEHCKACSISVKYGLLELLKQCAQALRATTSQPPVVSLKPALDDYWQKVLGGKVRAALQEIASHPAK